MQQPMRPYNTLTAINAGWCRAKFFDALTSRSPSPHRKQEISRTRHDEPHDKGVRSKGSKGEGSKGTVSERSRVRETGKTSVTTEGPLRLLTLVLSLLLPPHSQYVSRLNDAALLQLHGTLLPRWGSQDAVAPVYPPTRLPALRHEIMVWTQRCAVILVKQISDIRLPSPPFLHSHTGGIREKV